MRRRAPGLVVAVAASILGGQASTATASGFRCSRAEPNRGPSLNWTAREVPWGLSPEVPEAVGGRRDAVLAAIERSFEAWTEVECSDLELRFLGVDAEFEPGFNANGENDNAVGIRSSWPHDPDAIALTFTSFRPSSGAMLDADIELNGEGFDFVLADDRCQTAVDLGNVLTHEAGHLLGLDHPPRTPRNEEATMFGNAPLCETKKRTLAEGDIEGLCTIYPRGQPTQQCFGPGTVGFEVVGGDDGFDGGCRATAPAGWPWALGLGLAAWRARRRRRNEG